MDADADGEAVYAHYALHRLKILPSTLVALPLASIDLQIEKEKKEAQKAKRKGKKGR